MIRLFLAMSAVLSTTWAATAGEDVKQVNINQTGKSNIIVIFDRNKIVDFYDLNQMGRVNMTSVVQMYGDQYVRSVQEGYANYSHVLQINGEQAITVLSQGSPEHEPEWVKTTMVTKEAVDDSFLWNFVSGDLQVSVFAEEQQVSVLGRSH